MESQPQNPELRNNPEILTNADEGSYKQLDFVPKLRYGKVLRFQTHLTFFSQRKKWLSGLEFTKQTGKTLIKLLLQQSDLGLPCLS